MANRTVQFYGLGIGSSPAELTAMVDGVTVFTGAIPTTVDSSEEHQVLFTCELPVTFEGTKPVSITVNSGMVIFSRVLGNYHAAMSPVITADQWTVLTDPTSTVEDRKAIFLVANASGPVFSDAEIEALGTTHIDLLATPGAINDPETLRARYEILKEYNIANFIRDCSNPSWPYGYGSICASNPCGPDPDTVVDARSNVRIDGLVRTPLRDRPGSYGTWWWTIMAPSLFEFDLNVVPGLDS